MPTTSPIPHKATVTSPGGAHHLDRLNGPPKVPSTVPCILVAGGAGYIGSNTVLEILLQGGPEWNVVVVDNLSTSNTDNMIDAQRLSGKKIIAFHNIDLLDKPALDEVFRLHPNRNATEEPKIAAKSVPESWSNPIMYYQLNLGSTINLLNGSIDTASARGKKMLFVFSSSACTYGSALDELKYDFTKTDGTGAQGVVEETPLKPINPYGRTKVYNEEIIRDVCKLHNGSNHDVVMKAAMLRAHASGLMGEGMQGKEPPNLVPIVTRFAARRLKAKLGLPNENKAPTFKILGKWATPDTTPIRDFIHITDLARSHVAALRKLLILEEKAPSPAADWNCLTFNIGSGRGYSVLEIVKTVEKVSKVDIPTETGPRRDGDVGIAISDSSKAWRELGWKSEMSLEDMCRDAWSFELKQMKQDMLQLSADAYVTQIDAFEPSRSLPALAA
ncbi:UDP-glucose 4-epimerase 2 [Entophlyctis luteolus]|nr:UDP-glucose 4-epimerase 2 [Entophlyctis luteolus]